jgi:hypothetical protein
MIDLNLIKIYLQGLWAKYKAFIIVIGAAILALGYHQIVIDLLVSSANRIFGLANKKTEELKKEETADKSQAQVLIQHAADVKENEDKAVISDDWYKK